jgi:molybdopterin-guanine dinucleotide biosynthesis protein A
MEFRINGKPILDVIYDKFKNSTDDLFLQASNDNQNSTKLAKPDVAIHYDIIPDSGPLGAIYSALQHAKNDHVFVLAGDLPFIDGAILTELRKHNGYQLVVPRWENGFVEPLCAIYSKAVLPVITEQLKKNDLKISNLFKVITTEHRDKFKIKYINADDLIEKNKINEKCFKNINNLKDLEE